MTDSAVIGLPKFKYHPDPVATGVFVASDLECRACGLARGWIYTGAVYSKENLDDLICPWCIYDGTAHSKFDAEFVDPEAVGGYGGWSTVPHSIVEEVCCRTPSFSGWQQERWFTHCNDAAFFVGCAGKTELESSGIAAIEAIKLESGFNEDQWAEYFEQMDADYGPTAYLFRCLHCGVWGGYSDCV
jgi:uncharacterized protein CbrC (UPF0167 family)